MRPAILVLLLVAGCGDPDRLELFHDDFSTVLPDAAQPLPDLQPDLRPACVCRYGCRTSVDCVSLTGGMTTCDGQQGQCTGVDPCATDADCTASAMAPRCALASDSLQDCP